MSEEVKAEVKTEELVERLQKLEAELERKNKEANIHYNRMEFKNYEDKKANERATERQLKEIIIRECSKELNEYFLILDPRHGSFGVNKARFGEMTENVVNAVNACVRRAIPHYAFRLDMITDNFYPRDPSLRVAFLLGSLDGKMDSVRDNSEDFIRLSFLYNHVVVGNRQTSDGPVNDFWNLDQGAPSDLVRLNLSIVRHDVNGEIQRQTKAAKLAGKK